MKKEILNNLNDVEKQQLLLSCIPLLSNCESKAGNEGEAFFVNKDIVVKKYFSKIDNTKILEGMYDEYCKECLNFYNKGYKIPLIYTWTMLSRPDHSGFDYYLLEERIPGRELFLSNLNKLYEKVSDVYSEKEYQDILQNPDENLFDYKNIMNNYIHDFIEMNQRIESMSDDELQNFLEGVYHMFIECRYAIPDVHARNVLMHQQKLNLIDLYLEKEEVGYNALRGTPAENLLLARVIALFDYNSNITSLKANPDMKCFDKLIDLNEDLCTEAIKKVIRASKKICSYSSSKEWWERLIKRLEKSLDKDRLEDVLKEVDIKIL